MTALSPLRVGRVTASRAAKILGLSPYGGPQDAMREMIREWHHADPDPGNSLQAWGHAYEDEALDAYEQITGLMTERSHNGSQTVIHPEYDWLAATPDAWSGIDGLVEIKCPPARARYRHYTDRPDYEAQMQVQLACANRSWCDFVVYHPDWGYPAISTMSATATWLPDHIGELRGFWLEFDAIKDDPAMCAPYLAAKTDERTDEEWAEAATEYLEVAAEYARLEGELYDRKHALIALTGDVKSTRGAGVSVTRSDKTGNYTVRRIEA